MILERAADGLHLGVEWLQLEERVGEGIPLVRGAPEGAGRVLGAPVRVREELRDAVAVEVPGEGDRLLDRHLEPRRGGRPADLRLVAGIALVADRHRKAKDVQRTIRVFTRRKFQQLFLNGRIQPGNNSQQGARGRGDVFRALHLDGGVLLRPERASGHQCGSREQDHQGVGSWDSCSSSFPNGSVQRALAAPTHEQT